MVFFQKEPQNLGKTRLSKKLHQFHRYHHCLYPPIWYFEGSASIPISHRDLACRFLSSNTIHSPFPSELNAAVLWFWGSEAQDLLAVNRLKYKDFFSSLAVNAELLGGFGRQINFLQVEDCNLFLLVKDPLKDKGVSFASGPKNSEGETSKGDLSCLQEIKIISEETVERTVLFRNRIYAEGLESNWRNWWFSEYSKQTDQFIDYWHITA